MFDYLIGKITAITPPPLSGVGSCCLEVEYATGSGIGYLLLVNEKTLEALRPHQEKTVKMYVYHQVSESEENLYGFTTKNVRNFFRLLLQVSGIGPKLALKILGISSAAELAGAIQNDNLSWLRRVKGLGPKTAARLLLELKPKLQQEPYNLGNESEGSSSRSTSVDEELRQETEKALKQLEFRETEIKKALREVFSSAAAPENLETAIKQCLERLKGG